MEAIYSENPRWETWNLGGNNFVRAFATEDGRSIVWYPSNFDTDEPTLAVFEADDEEWAHPVVFVRANNIDEAERILRKGGQ